MAKLSAGLLLFRWKEGALEVFLVHPGGPFWAKKDLGAWSIPKGEYSEGEDALAAARREFEEETGIAAAGELIPLKDVKQPGGKIVKAWAIEGDCDASALRSNMFSMEWPPRSGRTQEFPEVDRGGWFSIEAARAKLLKGQLGFLDELEAKLGPALVRDFEACALPAEAFHHREHILVAWTYLRRMDYPAAVQRMSEAIRRFADFHGATAKYHHTLTLFWMRLVAAAIRADPHIDDFDRFAAAHPELFDPASPQMFYSPGLLQSEAARTGWVEPDILPLP